MMETKINLRKFLEFIDVSWGDSVDNLTINLNGKRVTAPIAENELDRQVASTYYFDNELFIVTNI